jgi:hypothetical protein
MQLLFALLVNPSSAKQHFALQILIQAVQNRKILI